jgi:hypothetical protein
MKELRGLDLKRAQLVPSSVFASPDEVVGHPGLSPAQKLAILRRWEFDARRVAGFAGAKPGSRDAGLLLRVRRALHGVAATFPSARREQHGAAAVATAPVALALDDDGADDVRTHRLMAGDAVALDEHPARRRIGNRLV